VQERFTAALATFAAALTVLLTCLGVYGLLAYSVTARKREICVRHGPRRHAPERRQDDRAGRPGDCRARRAHWRSVRVGCRAARTGAALRHRSRRSRTLLFGAALSSPQCSPRRCFRRCARRGWRPSKHCVTSSHRATIRSSRSNPAQVSSGRYG
jgi:hypothetical protein